MKLGLVSLTIIVVLTSGACVAKSIQMISPYYGFLIKRLTFGHTRVTIDILGFDGTNGSGKSKVLCESVFKGVGLLDGKEGKKLLFVHNSYKDRNESTHVSVASDGKTIRDVTDAVVRLGRATGQIGPYAEIDRDFRFSGAGVSNPGAVVYLGWLRSDLEPRPDAIRLTWSDIRAALE